MSESGRVFTVKLIRLRIKCALYDGVKSVSMLICVIKKQGRGLGGAGSEEKKRR